MTRALIVTAHPDDETIFFGGTILENPGTEWHVICVTDGNAAGLGTTRAREFAEATRRLGVARTEMLGFPDIFEQRLDTTLLISRLVLLRGFDAIYTHSAHGDYGHPHHQDVSYAVHQAFGGHPRLWSIAYNLFPGQIITLAPPAYELKWDILWGIYQRESRTFLNNLPVTATEAFCRISPAENEAIYRLMAHRVEVQPESLEAYRRLLPYLRTLASPGSENELFTL